MAFDALDSDRSGSISLSDLHRACFQLWKLTVEGQQGGDHPCPCPHDKLAEMLQVLKSWKGPGDQLGLVEGVAGDRAGDRAEEDSFALADFCKAVRAWKAWHSLHSSKSHSSKCHSSLEAAAVKDDGGSGGGGVPGGGVPGGGVPGGGGAVGGLSGAHVQAVQPGAASVPSSMKLAQTLQAQLVGRTAISSATQSATQSTTQSQLVQTLMAAAQSLPHQPRGQQPLQPSQHYQQYQQYQQYQRPLQSVQMLAIQPFHSQPYQPSQPPSQPSSCALGPEPWAYQPHQQLSGELKPLNNLFLLDEHAGTVLVPSLFSHRRVLLVFLRHFGCRFCRMQTLAIQTGVQPLLRRRGVEVILVSIGTPSQIAQFKVETGFDGEVYVDPRPDYPVAYSGFKLSRGRGLFFDDDGATRPYVVSRGQAALDAGHVDGGYPNGESAFTGDIWQVGGMFVLESERCLWAHRSAFVGDSPEVETIVEAATGARLDGTPTSRIFPGWDAPPALPDPSPLATHQAGCPLGSSMFAASHSQMEHSQVIANLVAASGVNSSRVVRAEPRAV